MKTSLNLGADIEVQLVSGTSNGAPVAGQWRKHTIEDACIVGGNSTLSNPAGTIKLTHDTGLFEIRKRWIADGAVHSAWTGAEARERFEKTPPEFREN